MLTKVPMTYGFLQLDEVGKIIISPGEMNSNTILQLEKNKEGKNTGMGHTSWFST
jgi:hypothetical protein